ncbi:MAG: DMT family transporter [Betaproteobacteria bacterium]
MNDIIKRMDHRLTPKWALLLCVPPLMWAGNAVVGRLMVGLVPPLTLNLLRWAVALLILIPLGLHALRTAEQRAALWERRWWLALIGLLGVGVYNALQYGALVSSTPLNTTLIAASSPLWMLVVGTVFFGQRITATNSAAALLSLAGVCTVVSKGTPWSLIDLDWVVGDIMMVLAAVSWSFYSWLLAKPPAALSTGVPKPGDDWAGFLLVQTLFGIGWAAAAAAGEQLIAPTPVDWSPSVVGAILFVAVCPSILAYRCWGMGVAHLGPAVTAFFGNLSPLFAALLQIALLGELPRIHHVLAFALILSGIAVSSLRR